MLQGDGTHNPFPDNETLRQTQDPAQHTTRFQKEKFMRDAVVADSISQTEPSYYILIRHLIKSHDNISC